ncbi:MAG: hypothetical protein U0235_14370 [Polyangiaceae bacterium]
MRFTLVLASLLVVTGCATTKDSGASGSGDAGKDGSASGELPPGLTGGGGDAGNVVVTPPPSDAGTTTDSGPTSSCPKSDLSVGCGATTTCTTGAEICCAKASLYTCVHLAIDCTAEKDVPTSRLECDDANDCAAGEVCCSHYAASSDFLTQSCVPSGSCSGTDFQVCTQDCECPSLKCVSGQCQ